MTVLASDLRYAVRGLLARAGFTTIVVFSLALGIGANAVIFSLASGLLWSAAPYPEPERLAIVWFTPPENPGARILATHANCAALRERLRSFQHLGCVLPDRTANLADLSGDASGAAGTARIAGQEFTTGVAEALAVAPMLGRWFTLEEEQRAEPVVVISSRLWERQFGGAPDIVGRQVRATNEGLASEVVTIIGVVPEGFHFLNGRTDYWLPYVVPRGGRASPARRLLVIGRLNPGVTVPQAQSEMDAAAAVLADEMPFTNRGWRMSVETVPETLQSGIGRPLLILQGVVACVLLIACGNVAGLLLAEGVARRGEMALRSALGAGRWRIVRQWLTESVLTSMLGAVLGLAFAWAGLRVLLASLPAGIPGLNGVSLNATVLAFTVILSVLTALIFGIAPALQASRPGVADALKRSGRSAAGPASGRLLRSAFVMGQISLAVVLSIGAGLMLHSLVRLRAVDTGIDTRGLMTFQIQLDGRDYIRDTGSSAPSGAAETELRPRLFVAGEQIRERLVSIPGVEVATAMSATPPLSGFARTYTFAVPGSETPGVDRQPSTAEWFPVLPDYFKTLRASVLQGRDFHISDTAAGLPVAAVNKTMADELWPGEDPIGRMIQLRLFNDPPRQIVAVVADVRQSTRLEGPRRQIYIPFAQLRPIQSGVVARGVELLTFVVRFSDDSAPLAEAFRRVVAEVDPTQPVTNIQPLEQYVSDQLGGFRQYAMLLTVFGTVAVVLALIGNYGLMAHSVSQRINEIGIRMALGATGGQALRLILRRGIVVTAVGLVVGITGALALTRVLAGFLWEVTPTDPLTFSITPASLAAVSLLACYTAARRTLKIDPAVVIRQE